MILFHLLKKILLEIQRKDKLIDLKTIKKQNGLLILQYITERGLEQEIVAKSLKLLVKNKKIPANFYGYILWIAGEIVNNIFDHAQTLGKTLKGGLLAVKIKNNFLQIAIGDLGIGLKNSLDKNPQIQIKKIDARQAIKLALTENTSGWPYKRGNGLPDVLRIIQAGQGKMIVCSDQIIWTRENSRVSWVKQKEKMPGVIVACEIKIKDFRVPRRGQPKGQIIKLAQFGRQLSGREKGQTAYETLVKKMTELPKAGVLLIDLSEVIMMNSSFGDQAIGVLLENIKDGHFGAKKVFFTGQINEVVDLCLDRIAEIRKVEIIKV